MESRRSALILPYGGVEPAFGGPALELGESVAVLGRATIGKRARLRELSVIRADGHYVKVGDDFHLGPRSTVHIVHEILPAIIGDRVTVGANACVHACTVGNDVVIGDGAVILDGAVIEDEVAIEPDSIVLPGHRIGGGQVCAGLPAKALRPLVAGELAERRDKVSADCSAGVGAGSPSEGDLSGADPSVFIASTARVAGKLQAAENSSVWFSCDFDAGVETIRLRCNSNVQDNTLVRAAASTGVAIGQDTTIGHNVRLCDCTIGDRALIGIGSRVESGTIVEDGVLLAAGAWTSPGQRLESGFMWGGRPARRLARLDAKKLAMIALTVEHYRHYAKEFMAAEKALVAAGSSPRGSAPQGKSSGRSSCL
ncbi:MAG: gamma carbonic anhydrase family protein [Methylobacteriaceae bacterium]|nr:gamma carbonic anhydrase family protein [Methylobacteriaceae bacterium]